MARAWMALMLVVGLAATACVAQRHLSYEEIVTEALRIFNQGRWGQSLFGLVEAIPPANSNSTTRTKLSFRIKETVCISGRRREPRECAFKADGEERNCTGIFFMGHGRILLVDCRPGPLRQPETFREKRSTESAKTASAGADTSKLPPAVRDMYERAKYDIIANILSNF
ncbi:cathelicidin antimicrobial peptide [Pteropus alecto]|uniref:cathelicidin antimicrobial peptide n=1 Tax=Pteropus alecto TaxID=9402 RepID=UPI0003F14EA1|nr:cathelicidin antimicrobial peptide [Pteropus alecto]